MDLRIITSVIDKNTLSEETDLFYNVETKTFSILQDLPEDVFNNFKPIKD